MGKVEIEQKLVMQVETVTQIHQKDLDDGYGSVYMPFAFEKKYPNSKYETKWQFMFPMNKVSKDPRSEIIRGIIFIHKL